MKEKYRGIVTAVIAGLAIYSFFNSNKQEEFNYKNIGYYNDNSVYDENIMNTINNGDALTDEQAESLRGTGFHNTRPYSSAEDMEIKAATVKCKKCGKHSDNGSNSLCDYCQMKDKND